MRFVSPETVRIPLENSDWIEVKKELTVGEDKRFRSAGLRRMSQRADVGANEVDVDWTAMALARVEAYLVEWSAKNAKGKDLPVTRAAIEALATEDFEAIDTAIQQHIERMVEEKKATAGTPLSTGVSA